MKKSYYQGQSPQKDAWLTTFFIENHLDYYSYPYDVASPEQIMFMVYTEPEKRYYPCSDRMFDAIISKEQSAFLQKKYNKVLEKILNLIEILIEKKEEKSYLESLMIKYKHETKDEIMIPSRLEKRLMRIFINRTQIEDPCISKKNLRNLRVRNALSSDAFNKAINYLADSDIDKSYKTLAQIREIVECIELKRLFSLSVESSLWESDASKNYTKDDYIRLLHKPITGDGIKPLLSFLGIEDKSKSFNNTQTKKILWLANEAGEIMIDLAIIRFLTKLGHKIIIAFKEGSLFTKVTFHDAHEDEILNKELEGALLTTEKNLGKNKLLKIMRSDKDIIVIPDGTREKLNLLLTSPTFARIFKEVDGVISRGKDQRKRLFDTHFQFTQDIFNISDAGEGSVSISYKPKHPSALKFSHKDLEKKAKTIIDQMYEAKKKGMTVIFYSGIIASIPGKIDMAKKIMSVFIEYLKKQLSMTFIINPSEYFEPGMDADDLMYMWKIVQTSGLVDIWRFQSYNDIAKAFQIMNKKIPPEWVGKDATFSTGCTKEMKIALEVLKKHPEMQIIGPSKEKFMRRDEYGIGLMHDKRLSEIAQP